MFLFKNLCRSCHFESPTSQFGEIHGAVSLKLTPKNPELIFLTWIFLKKSLAYLVETVLHMPKSNDTQWPKSILHGSKMPFYILKWCLFFFFKTQKNCSKNHVNSWLLLKIKNSTENYINNTFFFSIIAEKLRKKPGAALVASAISTCELRSTAENFSTENIVRRRRRGAFGSWWWSWWCERRRSDSNETRERFQTCSDPENLNWHPPASSSTERSPFCFTLEVLQRF